MNRPGAPLLLCVVSMEKIGVGRNIIEESLTLSLLGLGITFSSLSASRAEGVLGKGDFEEKDEGMIDVDLGKETGVFAVGV